MKELLTPKQVARAIGASESSLKRWCDRGRLNTVRTAGGHRRIPIRAVLDFVRTQGITLVDPEVLGLPSATGTGDRTVSKARENLVDALRKGQAEISLRCVLDMTLANQPLSLIFDEVVGPAMRAIGHEWSEGRVEVYQERRSVEICARVLHELGRLQAPCPTGSPRALSGTVDGDPYTLAARMAELILTDVGYRAVALGNELPFETLQRAIQNESPDLFCLSISAVRDLDVFCEEMNALYETCADGDVRFVIGGVALNESVRGRIRYDRFCETMAELEDFARSVLQDANEEDAGEEDAGEEDAGEEDRETLVNADR